MQHTLTDKEIVPHRETVVALAKSVGGNVDEALKLAGYATAAESAEAASAEFIFKFGAGLVGLEDLTKRQQELVQRMTQSIIDGFHSANLSAEAGADPAHLLELAQRDVKRSGRVLAKKGRLLNEALLNVKENVTPEGHTKLVGVLKEPAGDLDKK